MQILDANTLVGTSVEGIRGSLTMMSAIDEPALGTQIVVVPANTKAPKPGQRLGSRLLIFVLQGSATLSNGEFYQKVTAGKLVMLEPGEERVYQTEREKCVCLEFRVGAAGAAPPETVPSIAFVPAPAPEAVAVAPKKSAAVYEEI